MRTAMGRRPALNGGRIHQSEEGCGGTCVRRSFSLCCPGQNARYPTGHKLQLGNLGALGAAGAARGGRHPRRKLWPTGAGDFGQAAGQ